jgi:F-type H+-transporting ATPase subunit b
MPQLDVSTFTPQLVWLAITFIGLYLLMTTLVLPRIGRVLALRKDRIEGTLARAQTLKTEAEAARDGYDKALTDARAKATSDVNAVLDRTKADINAKLDTQAQMLNTKARAAEETLGQARDKALASVNDVAAEIAKAAAEKLLGGSVDAGQAKAAVAAVRSEKR